MDFYNFFSFSAKKAIYRASEICVQFNNQNMEPEHIFFSILNLRSCSAMKVLHQLGVNVAKLNYSLEAYLYEHAGSFKGTPSFSARTLTLLDNSYKEVKRLHHREIGTTHLLVALAEERHAFLRQLFDEHNLTAKRIRDTFMTYLEGSQAGSEVPLKESGSRKSTAKSGSLYGPEVAEILRLAKFLAARLRHPQIGIGHIMYAFSTLDFAFKLIEAAYQIGPLKPSRVLVRIAQELDRLQPDFAVDEPILGSGATGLLAESFRRSLDKHQVDTVEIGEFSEVLLEQAGDYYQPILAECTLDAEHDTQDENGSPGDLEAAAEEGN